MTILRRATFVTAVAAGLGAAAWITSRISPWPTVLPIRIAFDAGGRATSAALARHVPAGIAEQLDLPYDASDRSARLDVFYPAAVEGTVEALPTIVWVHGGAWISGSKGHVANYLRILAGEGFTTVGLDYSIAPGATYPTPVRQVNVALGYLVREAHRLHIDASRIVLAGDSAGAHIAAQVANLVTAPPYAKAVGIVPAIGPECLRGALLFCGPYDLVAAARDGSFGGFVRSVLWAYLGTKDFAGDPRVAEASVARHVTAAFPPAFISVGNADPLTGQSRVLAEALVDAGATVETLFYPDDHRPALHHEYQFYLDSADGRLALERSLTFLGAVTAADRRVDSATA